MAKNATVSIEVELITSSLQDSINTIEGALSKTDLSLIKPEQGKELNRILTDFQTLQDQIKDTEGKGILDPKLLKMFKGSFKDVSKDLGKMLKDIQSSANLDVVIDTKQLDAATNQLQEYQKELKKAKANQAKIQGSLLDKNTVKFSEISESAFRTQINNAKSYAKAMGPDLIENIDKASTALEAQDMVMKRILEITTKIEALKAKPKQSETNKQNIEQLENYRTALIGSANAISHKTEYIKQQQNELDLANVKVRELTKAEQDQKAIVDQLALGNDATADGLKVLILDLIKASDNYEDYNEKVKQAIIQAKIMQNTAKMQAGETPPEIPDKPKEKEIPTGSGLGEFFKQFLKTQVIFNTLKQVMRETISTVKELDAAFNGIAIVSSYTTKQVWGMYGAFEGISKVTGFTVKEISQLSLEYFRQGKSLNEVMKLTEAAASAAKIAGISAADSVQYLTSAINGFRMSADQAMAVSDKFAALAAKSATDYDGLATALSKVAAQAYTVGVNMDSMMGFIAKALETTQEAPENIGTAFKTIFARMSEIKDYGATLEDGMDVNRVEKALKTINVELRNQRGEMRNLDQVLFDVGGKWNGLNKNQKAYITTALAGTRQQSRLLAVFEDFDRTMELVDASANSLGATYAQQATYTESIAFAVNKLMVAWESFTTSIVKSDVVIWFFDTLSGFVEGLNQAFGFMGPYVTVIGALTLVLSKVAASTIMHAAALKAQNAEALKSIPANKLLMASLFGAKNAADVTTISNWSLKTSFDALNTSALPFIATAGAIVAILIVMVGVFALTDNATEKLAKSTEKLKKAQAELYKTQEKQSTFEQLIEQYEELDNKVTKTSEDMTAMKDIITKLNELEIGGLTFGTDAGGLNQRSIDRARKLLEEQTNVDFNNVEVNTLKALEASKKLNKSFDEYSPALQQGISLMNGMQIAGVKTYTEWKNLTREQREFNVLLGEAAERQKFIKVPYSSKDLETITKYEEVIRRLESGEGSPSDQRFVNMNKKDYEEAKRRMEQTDQINAKNLETLKLVESKWNAIGGEVALSELSINDANAAIEQFLSNFKGEERDRVKALLGDFSSIAVTIESINKLMGDSKLSDAWNMSDIQGIEKAIKSLGLSAEETNSILKDVLSSKGYSAARVNILNKENISWKDRYKILKQINDLEFGNTLSEISAQSKGLNSINANIGRLNEALSLESFDIDTILEVTGLYPELWESIQIGQNVSQATTDSIMKNQQDLLQSTISNQIAKLEIEKEMNNLEIDALKMLLQDKAKLYSASSQAEIMTALTTEGAILDIVKDYGNATINARIAAAQASQAALAGDVDAVKNYQAQLANLQAQGSYDPTVGADIVSKAINAQIASLEKSNKNIQGQIDFWKQYKVTLPSTLKKAGVAVETYMAQLNELFNIEQRLKHVEFELNFLDIAQADADVTELADIYEKKFGLMAEKAKLFQDKMKVLTSIRQSLLDANKDLQKYFTIDEYGNMILNMEKYNAASKSNNASIKKQIERLDELAKNYEDFTGQIQDATLAYEEQKQAIKELYDDLKERIKEANRNLIDTQAELANQIEGIIKDQLNAELEAIEKAKQEQIKALEEKYNEELKYLNDRKALYEKFFNEEQYQNELSDMEKERANIIAQLSSLEGASDYNSIKRAQELRKQLEDLNKKYTDAVNDYNKEALLDRLDEEIKATEDKRDEEIAALEKETEEIRLEYENRINDYQYMQDRIKEIMEMTGAERLEWFKQNSQEYIDANEWQKQAIIEDWKEQQTALEDAQTEYETVKQLLIEMGMTAEQATSTMNGNFSTLSETISNYVTNTNKSKTATDNLTSSLDKATAAAAALNAELANTPKTPNNPSGVTEDTKTYASSYIPGGGQVRDLLSDYFNAGRHVNGGSTEKTGWHWLDGAKGRPERVLSATQTEAFDKLVDFITNSGSSVYSGGNITIGEISISTPQLNSTQDFIAAGKTFAATVKDAIEGRGISINQKR